MKIFCALSIADIRRCHVTNCHVWRSCISATAGVRSLYSPLLPPPPPLFSRFFPPFPSSPSSPPFPTTWFLPFRFSLLFFNLFHSTPFFTGPRRTTTGLKDQASNGQPPATNNNQQTQVSGCKTADDGDLQAPRSDKCTRRLE